MFFSRVELESTSFAKQSFNLFVSHFRVNTSGVEKELKYGPSTENVRQGALNV